MLSSETLELPLVMQMDEVTATAMWHDANINNTQQRVIKRHLNAPFGKRVIILEAMKVPLGQCGIPIHSMGSTSTIKS